MPVRLETIDLNLLVALNVLLEEKHVTNAGARMHIGQSAMSGILRRLREYFGDELLVRVGNELKLTPFAESLVPYVQEAYRSVGALFSAGVDFDPRTSDRTFSLAVSDYIIAMLGEPLLREVKAQAPSVRVAFEHFPKRITWDPDGALLQHDLTIIPLEFLPAYADTAIPLFEDDFVVVMSSLGPAARKDPIEVEDLIVGSQVFAALRDKNTMTPLWGVEVHRALAASEPFVLAGSHLALPHLIRGSDRWGFMPRALAQLVCTGDDFVLKESPVKSESFVEHLFWHPSRHRDSGLAWMRDLVARVGASLGERDA